MRDHRPTSTGELLDSNKLNSLTKRVDDILAIEQLLTDILPMAIKRHCRVANLKDNYLTIHVANSSLQMKLNYERMEILSKLRGKGFSKLVGVDVKINPDLYLAQIEEEKIPAKRKLSASAAESILAVAETASPELKKKLQKLASLANRSD